MLELDRAHRLPQLRQHRAVGARLKQARDLHRDGRAAGNNAAICDKLERRAHDRERIDAVMLAETLVFVRDQQIEIARIDIRHRRRQSPAPVYRCVWPQQIAVAVHHDGGEFEVFAERCGAERVNPSGTAGDGQRCRNRHSRSGDASALPHTRSVPSPLAGEG